MNAKWLRVRISLIIIIISILANSCRKDEKKITEYIHFVSKELVTTYNKSYMNSFVTTISGVIPEAGNLKSLIRSDIKIYKVIYKTTIEGKQVNVSGLVCVPSNPGEYPVLSFQNGTNTDNSYAPTEFPIDLGYQSIEILASMGYIVVIADYPGFGESQQIPHPYLVADPTVESLVDLLNTVKEMDAEEFPDVTVKNEFYLLGYSQGGWSTLQLHKALELDYNDFNLKGSCCGAGPYNIYLLFQGMVNTPTYPMPVYLGYILNAYTAYHQFSNPVSDIFNEPYASRVPTLYTGKLSNGQINGQLTTSITDLMNPEFLSGYATSAKYSSVRDALIRNSISGWHTNIPLLMIHGQNDTYVSPSATENMYSEMIRSGTPADICQKVIIPGADHNSGVVPAMIQGFLFLENIRNTR